jgi:hypothetical protein
MIFSAGGRLGGMWSFLIASLRRSPSDQFVLGRICCQAVDHWFTVSVLAGTCERALGAEGSEGR